MTNLECLPIADLFILAGKSVGSGEGDIRPVNELIRRHLALKAERDDLVNAACAYIDRTANNSARDSTRERAALIACLPELGPMVWSDELQHYVRLPVEEVSRG